MTHARAIYETPIGPIEIEAGPRGVRRIRLAGAGRATAPAAAPAAALAPANAGGPDRAATHHLAAAGRALRGYLGGDPDAFRALALDLDDATDFQRAIYDALRRVPPGETTTYGALAAAADRPGAARAVGAAMARNPVPLAVPCHRVVGSTGALMGYSIAGPGRGHDLALKRRLLEMENGQVSHIRVI